MIRRLGSLCRAAFLPPVVLLVLTAPVLAATPAELAKDLLQTKAEIPYGSRWEIALRDSGGSHLLSADALVKWALYPSKADNLAYQKQSQNYVRDKSELLSLLGDAVRSDRAALVEYKDEYDRHKGYQINRDHKYIYVELAIWELASEDKAKQFVVVLNRMNDEAMAFASQSTTDLRRRTDSSISDLAKRVGQPSQGAVNATTATIGGYGDLCKKVLLGLGDEGATFEKRETFVHIRTVVADRKLASHQKVDESLGDRWCFSYARKGNRLLVVWVVSSYFSVSNKRVANEWVDGRQVREEYEFVAPPPYPQAVVASIIRSAYYKMAQEPPANDPSFVTITIRVPQTKHVQETTKTVFGPAFPDFKTAKIYGLVRWRTMFYEGPVFDAPIYVTVDH